MMSLVPGLVCCWVAFVAVTCAQSPVDGDLRLTERTVSGHGRLEIFYHGSWGTVCDDGFGDAEAGVACWQLGFSRHGNNHSTIGVESSNPPILLDDLGCAGSEDRLVDCRHRPLGVNDCKDEEHIALGCRVDPCRSSPCLNGATCVAVNEENFTCHCSHVAEGQYCEHFINFCQRNNGGCSHQCINNGNGTYQCACPDDSLQLNADGHTCYAPSVEVRCGETMEVAIARDHWPGLHEQYVTLTNQSCVARGNATHVTLSVPLYACGTQTLHEGHGFIFENRVVTRDAPVASLVSRVRDVNMTIRCHYEDDLFLDNWYIVNSDGIRFSDVARGHYQLHLDLFHNGNQYVVGNSHELVEPGESLSLKFSLSSNDSSLQVFARHCRASPSSGLQEASQYLFLNDGCGNNPTFHHNRTSNTQETLQLQAFQFLPHNTSATLLMHCDVIVCNVTDPGNRCTQGCLTGSDVGQDDVTMTQDGPVTLYE